MNSASKLNPLSRLSETLDSGCRSLAAIHTNWATLSDSAIKHELSSVLVILRERSTDFKTATHSKHDIEAFMTLDCLLRRWDTQSVDNKKQVILDLAAYLHRRKLELTA